MSKIIHAGLVVKFKNDNFRVPYLYPYVNLETRANILPDLYFQTNLQLWQLNLLFFYQIKEKNKEVYINSNLKKLMHYTNQYNNKFSDLINIINFCELHIKNIKKIIN